MAFTYDLTTDIGKIRLNINDKVNTSDEQAHFSDEELQVFLTAGGNTNVGSALALEAWAAAETDSVDSEHIGDYSYAKKAMSNRLAMADRFRKVDSGTPVLEFGTMDLTGSSDA